MFSMTLNQCTAITLKYNIMCVCRTYGHFSTHKNSVNLKSSWFYFIKARMACVWCFGDYVAACTQCNRMQGQEPSRRADN